MTSPFSSLQNNRPFIFIELLNIKQTHPKKIKRKTLHTALEKPPRKSCLHGILHYAESVFRAK